MRYLKLYEAYKKGKSINDWISDAFGRIDKSKYNIENLVCNSSFLTTLKGIEKFTKLKNLDCAWNDLTNLKGIETLTKLKSLNCTWNNLKNLDEVKNLPNLEKIKSWGNEFDYPLPFEISDKFEQGSFDAYTGELLVKFKTYEFQKEFVKKYPERVADLIPIDINTKLKQELPALTRGVEWGFFDLERSER